MNHLWRGKAFTIPGPVLNYGGAYIGGAQLMPVPPPKNPGCPNFSVGMPHAQSGGDALTPLTLSHKKPRSQANLYRLFLQRNRHESSLDPLRAISPTKSFFLHNVSACTFKYFPP
jgi:hypothetical protein